MFLQLCEELGIEVGKMPVLVPPSILAELQSLGTADSDQTSKKPNGKCHSSCQVKMFPFISAFLLSILPDFPSVLSLMWWALKRKTSPAWDTCVALLTRFPLHPPWLPLLFKYATGLLCFPLLFGLLYLQKSSPSKALFPHLLS